MMISEMSDGTYVGMASRNMNLRLSKDHILTMASQHNGAVAAVIPMTRKDVLRLRALIDTHLERFRE